MASQLNHGWVIRPSRGGGRITNLLDNHPGWFSTNRPIRPTQFAARIKVPQVKGMSNNAHLDRRLE